MATLRTPGAGEALASSCRKRAVCGRGVAPPSLFMSSRTRMIRLDSALLSLCTLIGSGFAALAGAAKGAAARSMAPVEVRSIGAGRAREGASLSDGSAVGASAAADAAPTRGERAEIDPSCCFFGPNSQDVNGWTLRLGTSRPGPSDSRAETFLSTPRALFKPLSTLTKDSKRARMP
eukprot:scaffold115120_cov31-Tisochrysis_lutea.AAC.6